MVSVKKRTNKIQISLGILPAILSVGFLVNQSWLILLFCVLSLFIIVGIVPIFKKREIMELFELLS